MVARFSGASMYSNAKLILEEAGCFIAKPFDKYLVKSKIKDEIVNEFETIEELYEWTIKL